jgi:hypothetical protein
MKHPSSRAFFAYWDDKRAGAAAPDRNEIEPGAVRELLGDIFVLSYQPAAGYPFRVAGTRVCALLGRDLKGVALTALFAPDSRREIEDILGIVAEETLPAVVGIGGRASDGAAAHLELLLLPFHARAHAPLSLTGLLAPLGGTSGRTVGAFSLMSWRTIGVPARRFGPRALRKWSVVRGLMVYEGLR